MRNLLIKAAAFLLISTLVLSLCACGKSEAKPEEKVESAVKHDFTGVWIATVYNINYPSVTNLSADDLKNEIDGIVECCEDVGIDTVFFQARGSGDGVLYKSGIFGVSEFLSDNGLTFDPFGYLIESAHEKGISVHAWINPLRASLYTEGNIPHPELSVTYNGMRYYDCGLPETRQFVCDTILEVIRGYDVDGVIFDDYFYPYPDGTGTEFDDAETYDKYGSEYDSVGDFRRASSTAMVAAAYECIKAENNEILFGISPFGIWKNGSGGEDGSLTVGMESYSALYCDTLDFVKKGYVDYISPQLYWESNFKVLYDWWSDMLEGTNIKLSVSLAASRYEGDWEDPHGILSEQETYARQGDNFCGCIYYGYNAIKNNVEGLKDELKEIH